MRHKVKGKKLNRNASQRKALFRSLISSLIIHEEIKTTESKAKAIKGMVDKLVAKAKIGSLHARRLLLAFIPNKKAVNKLVDEIAPRFSSRVSGFTRVIRLGKRRGDDAMMAKIEFIEKKEKKEKEEKKSLKEKKKDSKDKKSLKEEKKDSP